MKRKKNCKINNKATDICQMMGRMRAYKRPMKNKITRRSIIKG